MNAILYFDLFAVTFLIFLGFGGFKRGFVVEIGRIVGLIFTLWLSITYFVPFAEIIQQEISFNPFATLFISFFIIFSIAFIVTRVIVSLIDQIIGIKKTRLFNQLLGFVFAVLKGTIPIVIVLWAFELLPYQNWTDNLYENSKVARTVRYIHDKNIEYLNWNDPVEDGKDYVRSLILKESSNKYTEE